MYLKKTILFFISFAVTGPVWAGQTYPDLMDAAIYNTYNGGGYFYPANCSICHGNKPESASNVTTDFGTNFTFIGKNLLKTRPNLSNLTLTEMTTIVRGMAGYDPDSDGWTNEQEFGWDSEVMQFVNPSNPNDYFSNPTNAPPPTGGGVPVGKQSESSTASAKMGGCGMQEGAPVNGASSGGGWLVLVPIAFAGWLRRRRG